jgi:N-acyl-D-amino-acid deacylase
MYDTLIRNVSLIDGTGADAQPADVAVSDGRIVRVAGAGELDPAGATVVVEGKGRVLSPGFIDVHTHDDTNVIGMPDMLPKISQGITTVIVGNCGISATPVTLRGNPPEPINLLGRPDAFRYPEFEDYAAAVAAAVPSVNVGALVGHTSLRSNHMDSFDRPATTEEIAAMRAQLERAIEQGALGLSTGLAYANANAAPTSEILALAETLSESGALYVTHMRDEGLAILEAMEETFEIGRHAKVPVVISHMKCSGIASWGRSGEVLSLFDRARKLQPVGCDCYPYSASSTVLNPKAATGEFDIMVTWSDVHPEVGGRMLADIAADWAVDQKTAAERLRPAGAVYFSLNEDDVSKILSHPETAVGSDGLPNDPFPHPRLWGAFPRVLGHYCRDQKLFSLPEAVRKMTGLSAGRFGLAGRGLVREGYWADLVLFDPETVRDNATFTAPVQHSEGIDAVWVNGTLSYEGGELKAATGQRAGRFLRRDRLWVQP